MNVAKRNPVVIRNSTIDDASRIAEIQVDSWRAAYQGLIPDSYLQRLRAEQRVQTWRRFVGDPDSPLLVATQGDEVIGFCHVSPSRNGDSQNAPEIVAIYVDPSCWRKGVGQALCQSALSFAQERGFGIVTLWTLSGNHAAQRFYEAMGFHSDGVSKIETMPGFQMDEVRYSIDVNQG